MTATCCDVLDYEHHNQNSVHCKASKPRRLGLNPTLQIQTECLWRLHSHPSLHAQKEDQIDKYVIPVFLLRDSTLLEVLTKLNGG